MADKVVKVQVIADTGTAKQQLQDLQTQLQNISSTPINVNNASLVEANKAALELQQTLAKATNPTTGNLDLSIFSKELSKSGQSLQQYQAKLASIGPAGQQAFLTLSKAIATAEAPTNRISQKLLKFGQTIKNTINWQISSTLIHQIVGQFSTAINYAEKLNTSLTNIRIVTGASIDKMAQFAQQANETAKKLSTTTTEYTNASLIYYQQGLNDKEVAARAEVTLKMANVTGQSAQEVSNQMTAIWNNFAEGSSNLEHYADVITALGAATASSSTEIATGLQKFAAIADTVGLSYESATAALATITATTRQSADTVGTGLRTLFSRLQSLKLGETLEDGVDLTKYTKALDIVGVKALDATGELRSMDEVLSDLGNRWNLLSAAQQTALAQTVGGVRQYATIMALMSHWDEYEKNLNIAQTADGTLSEQQARYEEGWKAASNRVRASMETIYQSLLNDQGIIKIIDGFAGFLDIINNVIDSLGGMQGILLMISSLVTNKFAKDLPLVFQTLMSNVKTFFGFSTKSMTSLQATNQQILQQAYAHGQNPEQDVQIMGLMRVNSMNQQLAMTRNRMTEEEIANYQALIASTQGYYENLKPLAEKASEAQQATKTDQKALTGTYITPFRKENVQEYLNRDTKIAELQKIANQPLRNFGTLGTSQAQAEYNKSRVLEEKGYPQMLAAQQTMSTKFQQTDSALTQLLSLKRQNEDSILQSLELEKAELESRVKTNQERQTFLEQKATSEKGLKKKEQEELEGYRRDQARLEELGTRDKSGLIKKRQDEIYGTAEKDVSKVSYDKLINSGKENDGKVSFGLQQSRQQLESEAIGGVHAAAKRQGAWEGLGEQVKKQGEIWSSDAIGKMTPQQQAGLKQQMAQYADAVKTTAIENGLGDIFSGENDPVAQLKQKLQDGKTDIGQAFKEFIESITGEGDSEAAKLGEKTGEQLTQGVENAVNNARQVMTPSEGSEDALHGAVSAGRDEGLTSTQLGLPLNMTPPGSGQPPQHKMGITEGITRAASSAMMLVSVMKAAENAGQTFGTQGSSAMEQLSAALSTTASTAMTAGMMMKLAADMSLGIWGKVIAIVLAVGGALAGVITGAKKAQEEAEKTSHEADYNEYAESLGKIQEANLPIEEFNELYNTYKKLAAGSTEAAEAQQALINKALEVAKAYKDAHLYMAAVAGDLDTIEQLMDTAEYTALTKEGGEIDIAEGKMASAEKYLEDNLKTTDIYSDNKDIYALVRRIGLGNYIQQMEYGSYTTDKEGNPDGGYISWTVDQNLHFAKQSREAYEAAIKIRQALLDEYGATAAREMKEYKEINTYIEKYSDLYEKYDIAKQEVSNAEGRKKILESHIYDANTLEDYTTKREALLQSLAKEQELIDENGAVIQGKEKEYEALTEALDDTLKASRAGNMAQAFETISYAAESSGYNIKDLAQKYDEFIEKYGEEEGKQLFVTIIGSINSADGLSLDDAIEREIENAKLKLASSKLEMRISILTELQTVTNNTDATTGDYNNVFKKMSVSDKTALLSSMGLISDNESTYLKAAQTHKDLIASGASGSEVEKAGEDLYQAGLLLRQNEGYSLADLQALYSKDISDSLYTNFFAGTTEDKNRWITEAKIATKQEDAENRVLSIQQTQDTINTLTEDKNNHELSRYENNPDVMAYLGARYTTNQYVKNNGGLEAIRQDPEKWKEYQDLVQTQTDLFNNSESTKDILEIPDETIDSYFAINEKLKEQENSLSNLNQKQKDYEMNGFREALQLEADQWGISYDEVQEYAKGLRESGKFTEDQIEASERFALTQKKVTAGIKLVGDNLKTFQNQIKNNKRGSEDYITSLNGIKKGLSGILGIPVEDITTDFVEAANAAGLLEDVMNDVEGAVDKVYQYAGEQKILEGLSDELGLSPENFINLDPAATHEYLMNNLVGQFAELKGPLQAIYDALPTFNPGDLIEGDTAAMLDQFIANWYQAAGNLDGAMDALAAMGVELEFVPHTGEGYGKYSLSADGLTLQSTDGGVIPVSTPGVTIDTEAETTMQGYDLVYHKKGGGGGGDNSGGGGGKKEKDHKKPDTGTRYHTIKAKQSNNTQNKSEVNRKKERAFGAEKIKQAEKEIDLQKEALDLQRQYVNEITDYLAGDRQNMEKAFADLGISLTIDENGVITNFREVEEELLRQENELIDKYNDGLLDDDAYDDAQTLIDDAREYLEIYEETRDLYEEQMNALVEMMDGIQDSLLELTKTKIEIQIDISDEKLEWLEYLLDKLDDDAYQAAEAIALLGQKTDETLSRIDIYKSGLEEILDRKGFSLNDLDNLTAQDLAGANFTEAEIEQIREWKSALMDANKELLDMRETVLDKVIDTFDTFNDKVQESQDRFNQYNDILEKYKEITELLGLRLNQQNKELLDALGKATLANAQNQAASAKIIYETAKKAHDDAQKTYQDMVQRYGKTSPEAQQWENLINTTQEALDEAQSNWLDAWDNALQIAQEIYTTHIEQITQVFEEQVSGLFGSLDYLQSAFDRADQVGTEYLQDFEKLYELNKLNRDIQKEIDDSNNIRDKQALKKLQKEINDLQAQGVQLSQYDVDALRKKFELEQARQALEDARNDKSEVRLQRDANGNWGYVYTAAEDATKEAEQEYENKLYEYQKLNDDYIKELQSRVLETQAQYKEALAEIYSDTTLTDEQRQARIDELNAWKDAELAYFEDQLNNALQNQQDTLDLYYKIYGNSQAALADSWEETTLRMLTGAGSVEEYINNIQQAMLDMLNNSANALSDYNNDVDDTNEAAGVNTEEYASHVIEAMGEIGAASETTQEQVAALAEALTGEFTSALEAAVEWEDKYAQKMKEAIEQNEKFIQSLNDMIARLAVIESNDPELKIARANYMLAEAKHEKFVEVNGDIYDEDWEKAKKDWQEYLAKYAEAASYDTGGYTGSWGSEGRMAILHEKENVFNADDTERLLNAVQILKTIDLSAQAFADGFGNMLLPHLEGLTQTLDQNVHIEASFPNVTDHNEIELAFENLINKASQYANRKNMSSMTFQDMYTTKF